MDNDVKIIRAIKEIIKLSKFKYDYRNNNIIKLERGNNLIFDKIKSNEPLMVGRFGAVEARCVEKWIRNKPYNEYNIKSIQEAAGFFPTNKEYMDKFCEIYTESAKYADIMSVWGVASEKKIIDKYCNNPLLIDIYSLEPYFFNKPWSKALENKKVLIIHPFTETIKKQLMNKNYIFKDKEVLPDFKSVCFIKAIQSNACEKTSYSSWFEALDYMCKEIDKCDFDIAIIGAGAYGLPLAAYVKKIGKQSIQMAGATQILFGIRGKRWDSRKKYLNIMNEYWVRPSIEETPKGNLKVEGGTYW